MFTDRVVNGSQATVTTLTVFINTKPVILAGGSHNSFRRGTSDVNYGSMHANIFNELSFLTLWFGNELSKQLL